MNHITTTPFGRPVTAGLLAAQALASQPANGVAVPKWALLRDLAKGRAGFGVTDRDLVVLQALLSFHPEDEISDEGAIVFPSNASLAERAHGMAESTLRRHLAALVAAGLVLRHDSPNGKRYAARDAGGGIARAFGFDLAPLARRADEIASIAAEARAAEAHLKRLRELAVLRLRDAGQLVAYGVESVPGLWDDLSDAVTLLKRELRRKLDTDMLVQLGERASELLSRINARLSSETKETDGNDVENERHKQYSNRNLYESDLSIENGKAAGGTSEPERPAEPDPKLPLHLVLRACPDLLDYTPHGIRHWHELIAAAAFVRGMLGISPDAWEDACHSMTPPVAAIAVACILQRATDISKPGGYLRALSRKAAAGEFSPGPMVMALLKADNARAA